MRNLLLFFITIFAVSYMQAAPKLVSMTYNGGANSGGTLIQYTSGNSGLTSYYSLHGTGHSGTQGNADPYGSIIQASDGNVYGMTYQDGANQKGTLFQFNYSSNAYAVEVNFDSISGYGPLGSLLQANNGLLYGLTSRGGAHGGGTLFVYAIGSNAVTKLADLPSNAQPYGSLIQASDGNLYGMTKYDGSNSSGTIFEFNTTTNTYTIKYSLLAGAQPSGSLLEVGHDTLYGMTYGDGTNNLGTIFRYIPVTNTYTQCYTFAMATGGSPCSSLTLATNGLLYGTTALGGLFHDGVLFNYDIHTQIYTDIHDFNGTDGRNPLAGVCQASDGLLYGMTGSGGSYSLGNIFSFNIGTAALTSLVSFNGTDGASPQFGGMSEYITPPVILEQPLSQSTCPGTTVKFIASATYTASAQWQVSTNDGISFSTLATTSDTLIVVASAASNDYIYRAIFTDKVGSDTSNNATLTVYQPARQTINTMICAGGSYSVGRHTYSATGVYTDTFATASVHGCDSMVVLNLTIYQPVVNIINTSACQSYTAGGNTYTSTGNYTITLSGASVTGCDSTIILDVIISSTASSTVTTSACQSYRVGANTYTTSGIYTTTLPGASMTGCDSVVTLNLSVYPIPHNTISSTVCQIEGYRLGTKIYTESGTYNDTIAGGGQHGCDSIVTLVLTVKPLSYDSVHATICQSSGYTVGTHTYSESGIYTDTLSNTGANGCNYIMVLNLNVIKSINKGVNVSGNLCTATQTGATYQWLSCSTNEVINGATSQSYASTTGGDYRCIVTVGSCQDTTDCVSVVNTGVADVETHDLNLYPNPTSGILMVEQNNIGTLHLELENILGDKLRDYTMTGNKGQFDISGLARGVYHVVISDDKQMLKVIKVVKD